MIVAHRMMRYTGATRANNVICVYYSGPLYISLAWPDLYFYWALSLAVQVPILQAIMKIFKDRTLKENLTTRFYNCKLYFN